ncbi:hypothetical protein OM076_22890 [Solirubrobacter ginsenosidimutans]|uniref:Uncharacterized protein n=1 Tax=Solirubrobacter ginsenosidimutans TaxID=490573 RepID=A0A9X3S249_9ACTN|nr:hypothetical protein [Solirubrobacter ginsenosidimutans]MDA0163139.1 hypothetical protein [Solirubrobacter ginsenosidimutans]
MTVRCECCGDVTASRDGQRVICERCVEELEGCTPIDVPSEPQ